MEHYTEEYDFSTLEEEAKNITKSIIDEVVEWVCNLKNIENASDTVKKNIAAQAEVALDVACEGIKKARKEVTPERLSELVKTLIEKGTDPEFPEAVYYDNLTDNPNVIDAVIRENGITDSVNNPDLKIKLNEVMLDYIKNNGNGGIKANDIALINGYIEMLANICEDEQEMKEVFYKGKGSIPSYKETIDDGSFGKEGAAIAAEDEERYNEFGITDAVDVPDDDTDDTEDDQEFRKKVMDAIDIINGPKVDEYVNILVDLSNRAIDNFEEGGDINDAEKAAIEAALYEGLDDEEDQWTIIQYCQKPADANYNDAVDHVRSDIKKVLESLSEETGVTDVSENETDYFYNKEDYEE